MENKHLQIIQDGPRSDMVLIVVASLLSVAATVYSYLHGYIVAYGDAESHLNIAKRVVDSLTPGFAQLGGIWLPLPHLLLIPFVKLDYLWRTGLAGSIVSGLAYVISSIFIFRLLYLLTRSRSAGIVAALVFMVNPNILYLQSTPMTEMTLIMFFVLSSYYFIRFIQYDHDLLALVLAALFGFCASLSRYDGWFLVLMEALVLVVFYLPWRKFPATLREIRHAFDGMLWNRLEGRVILFASLAFFGIILWLVWDALILGDPLYFTHSQFSASSQQHDWLKRGQLPAYHNMFVSLAYYAVTSMENIGLIATVLMLAGLAYWLWNSRNKNAFYILLVLGVPFFFNVITLYLGQSVIFIPSLTPSTFEWNLFNVRYGVMMVPLAAVLIGFLFHKVLRAGKVLIVILILMQTAIFATGMAKAITLEDGISGLSSESAKLPDAQYWIARNYDGGLVLLDDFARTISVVRTQIPMQEIIYVGNKPYWDVSLKEPERYATWIVMQKNDAVWSSIYDQPEVQGRLFKYFVKAYTSPEILIFKRNPKVPVE